MRAAALALSSDAKEARATRESFADRFGDNQVYDRFEEAVQDRCSWTLRRVFGRG